jgi:hypothetical protein
VVPRSAIRQINIVRSCDAEAEATAATPSLVVSRAQGWHAACGARGMKKTRNQSESFSTVAGEDPAAAANSAGQSGDTQGLSDTAEAGSQSVAELVEDGQFFEAEVIDGVENAPDADVAEVHTRQVPEDDVPLEYRQQDETDVERG